MSDTYAFLFICSYLLMQLSMFVILLYDVVKNNEAFLPHEAALIWISKTYTKPKLVAIILAVYFAPALVMAELIGIFMYLYPKEDDL